MIWLAIYRRSNNRIKPTPIARVPEFRLDSGVLYLPNGLLTWVPSGGVNSKVEAGSGSRLLLE